jgi:hypothetical protein
MPRPNWRPVPESAGAVVLVGLLIWLWSGLYVNGSVWRLIVLGLAGLVCGLVFKRRTRRTWIVSAGSAVVALAVARGQGVADYFTAGGWSEIPGEIRAGFVEVFGARYPVEAPATFVVGVLLFVLATGVCTLLRRPGPVVAAIAVLGVAGYRWTVAPPGRPLVSGLVTAGLLVVVATRGTSMQTMPRRAIGLAAMSLVGAVGSFAVATDRPILDWRTWDLVARSPQTRQTISLEQNYGQLKYPARPVVMFRVNSEQAVELRGAVLTRFDGEAFAEDYAAPEDIPVVGGVASLVPADTTPLFTQRITQISAQTDLIFASGRPRVLSGLSGISKLTRVGESFKASRDLPRGSTYTVRTQVPDPGIAALQAVKPQPTTGLLRIELPGGGMVGVPPWGSGRATPAVCTNRSPRSLATSAGEPRRNTRSSYGPRTTCAHHSATTKRRRRRSETYRRSSTF